MIIINDFFLFLFAMQSYRKEIVVRRYKEFLKAVKLNENIPKAIMGMIEGYIEKPFDYWETFVGIEKSEMEKVSDKIYTLNFEKGWSKLFGMLDIEVHTQISRYLNGLFNIDELKQSNILINPSHKLNEDYKTIVVIKRKRLFCRMMETIYLVYKNHRQTQYYEGED